MKIYVFPFVELELKKYSGKVKLKKEGSFAVISMNK